MSTILVAVVVILAILLAGVRIIGLTPYSVLSGSMEPAYKTGSLIYVKSVPAAEIKVGDPITFVMNEDLLVATHRVVEIDEENEIFTTKGDANEVIDASPVHFKNLIGRPVFTIPFLGYLSNFMTNPPGMYLGWSVLAIVLILVFVPELLKAAEKSDQKTAAKKAAKLNQGESREAENK